jgi:hypothetical protein
MDKRYQVFVSSTFEDLQDERREVMHALLSLDCIPTGMELFPAADEESWELIKRFIASCDYYVVIVGGRYGSVGTHGKSYTEMEYDYAVEASLPVLAFLHGDPGKITADKTEITDGGKAALKSFRAKIAAARHAKYWTASKELPGLVALGMSSLMKIKPRVGWVRADQVADESAAQEILGLRRKIDELDAHIAETEQSAPPGTDGLAQGEEAISLHFRYESRQDYVDCTEAFSWNEILSILGPVLIIQATERDLKDQFAEAISNRLKDKRGAQIFHAYMRDEEFQKVKVQLRALGLIRELKDKSPSGGDSALWTLTPYGDRLMTQVAAIRTCAKT